MAEGAIINVERGRVRFREEPEGISYELRPGRRGDPTPDGPDAPDGQGGPCSPESADRSMIESVSPESADDAAALDVYRLDDSATNGHASVFLGRLVHGRQGWRPEMTKRDRLREQLVIIARAWNRALVLKK